MKLFFALFIIVYVAKLSVCQQCSLVCDQQQINFDPVAPGNSLIRGKMGPTGEKGEKGSVGEKGVDLSKEVGNLEHKLLKEERKSSKLKKFVKSMNATISVQAAEIKSLLQSSDEMNSKMIVQEKKIEDLNDTMEQNINETNTVIFNQQKRIEHLEDLLKEQVEKLELFSNAVHTIPECSLEHIKHLSDEIPRKIPHNTTVELSCKYNYKTRYQGSQGSESNRTCNFGNWVPNFYQLKFSCEMTATTLIKANETCYGRGTTLVFRGIETVEKRKEFCTKHELQGRVWIGIRRKNGRWVLPDGNILSEDFELDGNYRDDYLYLNCNKSSLFGKISSSSYRSYSNFNFLCEN